jgi:hypothetical protein
MVLACRPRPKIADGRGNRNPVGTAIHARPRARRPAAGPEDVLKHPLKDFRAQPCISMNKFR